MENRENITGRDLREGTFEFAVRAAKLRRALKSDDLASPLSARLSSFRGRA